MAEQTLFAHITLMAIGKTNEAKVMLRLASPAFNEKRCVAQYHFRVFWKSKRHILPFSDWLAELYVPEIFLSKNIGSLFMLRLIFITFNISNNKYNPINIPGTPKYQDSQITHSVINIGTTIPRNFIELIDCLSAVLYFITGLFS